MFLFRSKIPFTVSRMVPIKPVTLGDLRERGIELWAWCNDCSHNRVLPLDNLIDRFGIAQTAASIAAWARCSACDSRRVETRPAYESLVDRI